MSLLALALVLLSAFLHATWNLLAKRVSRGAPFVWLFAVCSSVLFAPAAAFVIIRERPVLGLPEITLIAGSAALHLGYMLALQRGYRSGDLSLVYPLARGSGPVLAVLAAVVLFGERPGPVAITGAALVVLGAFVLAGGEKLFLHGRRRATAYGLLTGLFIASYTITDAHGVSRLAIHPLILLWSSELLRALMLTPHVYSRFDEVREVWRNHRRAVLAVSVLSPLAYLLVLSALLFTPVSYVAPVREVSILFGAALGAGFLGEGQWQRRLIAAGVMVAGVAALTLG
ncbi:MAG: DMT family transporter [Trueperaceae bacterium]